MTESIDRTGEPTTDPTADPTARVQRAGSARRAMPAMDSLFPPAEAAAAIGRTTPGSPPRDLAAFTAAGYDKGRSRLWQAAWFATMNLVFSKWWLPARFRPAILRAFGAQVGARVLIRHRVRVLWPWKLTIGDDCWIGEGAWLLNLEPIVIEDDVCLSQESMLCTGSHRAADPAFGFDNAPIRIGRGAWVAARATVLRGVTVEPGEVVGAHAIRSRGRR
jgi:putative colanic acid biosynthesis acetyltransferase WcaF